MNLELKKLELPEIEFFQQKMVESFQSGVLERFGDLSAAPIPPEDDLSRCSQNENCDLWAIMLDGIPVGATVIDKNAETGKYSLDLFFIFKGVNNIFVWLINVIRYTKLIMMNLYINIIPLIFALYINTLIIIKPINLYTYFFKSNRFKILLNTSV